MPVNGVPEYPKRPPFFAMRFIRLMVKTVVATTLGEDVFALLTVIVTTEDSRRYKSAVTFFDGQLIPLTGAKTWKALNRARLKAESAKWLVRLPPLRGDRRPTTYWVTIPDGLDDIEDGPVDEGISAEKQAYQRGYDQALIDAIKSPNLLPMIVKTDDPIHSHTIENGSQRTINSKWNGLSTDHQQGGLPYPIPNPVPPPPTSLENGGGVGKEKDKHSNGKPSGWWAGVVNKSVLNDPDERKRLFVAAIKAGLIKDTPVFRVRYAALVSMAKSRADNHVGGYFIRHLEQGSWNCLTKLAVANAVTALAVTLSASEMALIREPSNDR